MAISKGSSTRREACCFTLAVDCYDAQNMECIVYAGEREQGYCCRSFIELAWQMERGFEEMEYPTPSVQKRRFTSFGTLKEGMFQMEGRVVPDRKNGRLGTFRVHVKQCLHATWQGKVSRDEKEQESALFENFLEFTMILDEMLTGSRPDLRTDTESLTDCLADALLLAGRYDGIRVEEKDSAEVLICGRVLANGGRETFAVRPLFRENHTFQGSVSWMEGRQQKNFRSFLELLYLMMSAAGKPAQKDHDM